MNTFTRRGLALLLAGALVAGASPIARAASPADAPPPSDVGMTPPRLSFLRRRILRHGPPSCA